MFYTLNIFQWILEFSKIIRRLYCASVHRQVFSIGVAGTRLIITFRDNLFKSAPLFEEVRKRVIQWDISKSSLMKTSTLLEDYTGKDWPWWSHLSLFVKNKQLNFVLHALHCFLSKYTMVRWGYKLFCFIIHYFVVLNNVMLPLRIR